MPEYPQAEYGAPQQHSQQHSPQYNQPYGQPTALQTSKNWMGITSLALTLGSLIFGITVFGGIVLGHMSIAAGKRGEATNANLGRWGMILGYIFLVIGIIGTVAFVMFIIWVENECGGTWPSEYC